MSFKFEVGETVNWIKRQYTVSARAKISDERQYLLLSVDRTVPDRLLTAVVSEQWIQKWQETCVVCGAVVEVKQGLVCKHMNGDAVCYGSFLPRPGEDR